jgi:hypothetical protein
MDRQLFEGYAGLKSAREKLLRLINFLRISNSLSDLFVSIDGRIHFGYINIRLFESELGFLFGPNLAGTSLS